MTETIILVKQRSDGDLEITQQATGADLSPKGYRVILTPLQAVALAKHILDCADITHE